MSASSSAHAGANGNHLKQKRARSQLSCTPCRTGKLKCNREKPHCDQCIKRSRETQCIYVPPPVKQKPVQNVKGRIRQLEELVVDLINQNRTASQAQKQRQQSSEDSSGGARQRSVGPFEQPTPPSDNDMNAPSSSAGPATGSSAQEREEPEVDEEQEHAAALFGSMRIGKNEISYVGESHWGAILNSISDLKRELGDDDDDELEDSGPQNPLGRSDTNATGGWKTYAGPVQPSGAPHGLGFMIGHTNAASKEQLLDAVPDKKVTDRLLSLWFNSPDPFKPCIHAPTFQEEYKRFWRNPRETPVMWLGLLFAILSLAASFSLRDVDPNAAQVSRVVEDVNRYHSLAASAAVIADFTKPKEYTLECLITYTAGLKSNNAFVNVWLMTGLIVRLALRMGCHRDAKHYPSITPFQGEMRRRIWAIISMIDTLISFQLGLPSMVRSICSDAQPPRNILDRDFNPGTRVLPQSRPIDELTPSSYIRAKLQIVRIFGDAAEMSHATIPPTHDEIMKLDRDLEEAKRAVPPLLQMPDITEVVTDPAEQLMCRFNLDLLYLKTKMILHRRRMLIPLSQLSIREQERGVGDSRRMCVECALRALQHHHTIYAASQPGGQLESVKWYMGSISTHDFLLAAMIICLELSHQISEQSSPDGYGVRVCPKRLELMDALEKSQKIWSDSSRRTDGIIFQGSSAPFRGEHIYDETEKAARAMAVMINKVNAHCASQAATASTTATLETPTTSNITADVVRANGEMTRADLLESLPRNTPRPFHGVVSNYDWSTMDGVPQMGETLHANNTPSVSADVHADPGFWPTASIAGPPPRNPEGEANDIATVLTNHIPDFPMIDDMLDTGDVANADWAMWDSQFVPNNFPQQTSAVDIDMLAGLDQPVLSSNGILPIGAGEAVLGRTFDENTTAASVVPRGPSAVAWAGSHWATWSEMDSDQPLPDFHLNMSLQDYQRNGGFPVTPADWEEFRRRSTDAQTSAQG